MIHQECATCGKELTIPDKYAGTKGRCKHCGARILVMQAPTPPSPLQQIVQQQHCASPPPPPPPPPPPTSPASFLPPDSNWYYLQAGNSVGPYSPVEIESLIRSGKITQNTIVWSGQGDWQPARDTLLAPLLEKSTKSTDYEKLMSFMPKSIDYGKLLLIIPIIGLVPVYFFGIWGTLFVLLGTAIIAAWEAKTVRMKSNRMYGTYGPIAWFIIIVGIWIFGYPAYLFKRKYYGLRNYGIPGVAVAGIFLISLVLVSSGLLYKVSLEGQCVPLVTEIISDHGGTTECVRIIIDEEPFDGFYKATALLENGNDISITIREMANGDIKVVIPNDELE